VIAVQLSNEITETTKFVDVLNAVHCMVSLRLNFDALYEMDIICVAVLLVVMLICVNVVMR
jgi:hypothetical protein